MSTPEKKGTRGTEYQIRNDLAYEALHDFWFAYSKRNCTDMRRANVRLLQAYLPSLEGERRRRALWTIRALEASI